MTRPTFARTKNGRARRIQRRHQNEVARRLSHLGQMKTKNPKEISGSDDAAVPFGTPDPVRTRRPARRREGERRRDRQTWVMGHKPCVRASGRTKPATRPICNWRKAGNRPMLLPAPPAPITNASGALTNVGRDARHDRQYNNCRNIGTAKDAGADCKQRDDAAIVSTAEASAEFSRRDCGNAWDAIRHGRGANAAAG
jgi:hypothetical protein